MTGVNWLKQQSTDGAHSLLRFNEVELSWDARPQSGSVDHLSLSRTSNTYFRPVIHPSCEPFDDMDDYIGLPILLPLTEKNESEPSDLSPDHLGSSLPSST